MRRTGIVRIVTRLLFVLVIVSQAGCVVPDHLLIWASRMGRQDLVIRLLNTGADVNAKDGKGITPLMHAAYLGHVDVVEVLLGRGAHVNGRENHGFTVLMQASFGGHIEVVKLLLERGADINARDRDGGTALTAASMMGNVETVRLLLEKGAEVSASLDGSSDDTALKIARDKGHGEIVELLKARGAKE